MFPGGARGREKSEARKLGRSGQSVLEFILTLSIMFFFVLFFLQLALMFAAGNYVHYATFMAARAYLSATGSPSQQFENANAVLKQMLKKDGSTLDRWPGLVKGQNVGAGAREGVEEVTGAEVGFGKQGVTDKKNRALSWQDGVRYTFRGRLIRIPLGGTTASAIELTSESWLGREPSFDECDQFLDALRGADGDSVGAIFDNGC
ncbi:MAG: hypothetical protein AB7F66_07340 [Bacteriovoracia bacterium]